MPYPMSENGRRDNKRHHLHKAKGPQVQIPVELAEESLSGKQILDIVNPGLNRWVVQYILVWHSCLWSWCESVSGSFSLELGLVLKC